MNYKDLDLKVGMEFHQRLDSHKLFCDCKSEYGEEEIYDEIIRKLRPVAGELGEIDPAATLEFVRGKTFDYQISPETTCLVEEDEEPPHLLNEEALDIALEIALLLNCDVIDEVHVMRKTVIDGSNTAGFQRTAMIGHAGNFETSYGKVPIEGIFLEEEAAGIVEEENGKKVFRLDRLGIPLVEIATGIMKFKPKEVKDVALKLGTLLRVTGKVQRGIGSIRQDVNVSIKGGERVELKGVQELRILDKMIDYEIQRQQNLLKLREEMINRNIKESKALVHDLSKYFRDSKLKFLKGKKAHGVFLSNFKGLLGFELTPGRRFGTELASIAKSFGFGGVIHTDENLGKYGIKSAVEKIKENFGLGENDSIIFLAGENSKEAFEHIVARINYALKGVPKETRRALPDGNSEYMRPLPGAARLYPETDIPPVFVSQDRLAEIKKALPEKPEQVYKKLKEKYKLSDELAGRLITSRHAFLFYEITSEMFLDPNFVANTLLNTITALRREGINVKKLSPIHLKKVFKAVKKKDIPKSAVPNVLRSWAGKPREKLSTIIKKFRPVSEEDVEKRAKELIKENKELLKDKRRAFRVLMGRLMDEFKDKVEGGTVSKILKKELR